MLACTFGGRILCLRCDTAARKADELRQLEAVRKLSAQAREAGVSLRDIKRTMARRVRDQERAQHRMHALWQYREYHAVVIPSSQLVLNEHYRKRLAPVLAPSQPLRLAREPARPYDRHGVAVALLSGERLGQLPQDIADGLGPSMDAGVPAGAWVARVTGGIPGRPYVEINVFIKAGVHG
jgi:hypothetical protein